MKSIYDEVKTARELVETVMMHGLSTKTEDVVRAQDVIGHSTVDELVELANDIGRNNGDGKPDPNGSWSSGRRGTRSTFYMILFNIWNWEDAMRFWNEHSNPDHETTSDLKEKEKYLRRKLDDANKKLNDANDLLDKSYANEAELLSHLESTQDELRAANDECIRLKAKLYDLMMSIQEGGKGE